MKHWKSWLSYALLVLAIPAVVLLGNYVFDGKQYAFLSLAVAILACIPFFLRFERGENGWSIKKFGFSLFLANPLLICLVVRFVLDAAQRRLNAVKWLCMALFLAQMFLLLLHRTFGGFQFGARYAFDLVPYYVAYLCADERRLSAWEIALTLAGLAFSLYGVSVVHI